MAADVTGKWNATATVAEGQDYKLEMTFRNEGGKLTGALSTDAGGTDLQDVQLQGDELTFKIPARGGYALKFTVKGDSMAGTFTSAQGRTGKVTASRVAEKPAVAGHWKAEAKTAGGQPTPLELDLTEEAGKLSGSVTRADGTAPLNGVKLEGKQLSFTVDADGGTYAMKLVVEGNQMKGGYTAPDGGTGTFTATR